MTSPEWNDAVIQDGIWGSLPGDEPGEEYECLDSRDPADRPSCKVNVAAISPHNRKGHDMTAQDLSAQAGSRMIREVYDPAKGFIPSATVYGDPGTADFDPTHNSPSNADLAVASIFAAMDDLRELAIMLRDAAEWEIADEEALVHTAANQLRRLMSQLGVEAERLDGNIS